MYASIVKRASSPVFSPSSKRRPIRSISSRRKSGMVDEAANFSGYSPVPSVEPSSTATISMRWASVWARTDSRQRTR